MVFKTDSMELCHELAPEAKDIYDSLCAEKARKGILKTITSFWKRTKKNKGV